MSKKLRTEEDKDNERFPLPEYAPKDDIYSKEEEEDIDPETGEEIKQGKKKDRSPAEDLDIPGTELDDKDEVLGEEDEENNYYSLGGDDHDDLEDDKGD